MLNWLKGLFPYEFILIILGFGALLTFLIGRFLEKYDLGKEGAGGLALGLLGGAFLVLASARPEATSLLVFDNFTKYVGGVIFLCSFLVSLASLGYPEIEFAPEYFALLVASTLGMFIIPLANNLIVLYAGWELMSIPAYVLVALKTKRTEATEAAFKYFIFGGISSALILYGMSIMYSASGGTLTISLIANHLKANWEIIDYIGLITLTAGFGIKVGIVPFHMWIPDAYQGGPLTTSMFLTTSSKNAGFGAMSKVLIFGLALAPLLRLEMRALLAILAVITMIVGNFFALTQKSVIRMLAYSSITHAGYVLVGITIATTKRSIGLTASLFHLLTYSISDIAAFICAAFFLVTGFKTIEDYEGLGKHQKFASFTMAFALLSLAGIPGLGGFASKLTLFLAGISGGMLWLSIALALNSAFSLGYYARLVKRMFLHEGSADEKSKPTLPKSYILVFAITIVLILIMGIRPGFFVNLANV